MYTGSIHAIATYGWELGHTDNARERLRKLQYKAMRKSTGGYHGARQSTLEEISKVEPVEIKIWDMKVRASARILEKGVQDHLIEEVEKHRGTSGRGWKNHSLAWAQAQNSRNPPPQQQYNTSLEEILAAMGENGERRITWDFDRAPLTLNAITEKELGSGETLKVVWELRIRRELEEEGWTVCYTDGSGLDDKASGAYTRRCHLGIHEDRAGSEYLGIKATHYDGELSGKNEDRRE